MIPSLWYALFAAVAFLITGCVTVASAAAPAPPTPSNWAEFQSSNAPQDKKLVAEIRKMQWWDACANWGRLFRSNADQRRETALRAYLTSEEILNPIDISHAGDRSVAIGMSECGVLASKGKPDSVNHTTTSRGTHSQLVYQSANLYVYTEESPISRTGIVRSFQH